MCPEPPFQILDLRKPCAESGGQLNYYAVYCLKENSGSYSMSQKVTAWLEKLGLGQYAITFAENELDIDQLVDLSDDDMKELGISIMGHRKTLFRAINALQMQNQSETYQGDSGELSGLQKPISGADAERRQLTVMFCDLVGSTELSQQLDPEDLREVNRAYQDACKISIEYYEGYVARYMGDGVLAYFGFPQAHEDDAERAVHAGLKVAEDIAGINQTTGSRFGVELAVRIGIATGPVVVGDVIGEAGSQENAVVGETPNLAARLESLAESNTVVIGPGTQALVSGRFEFENLGERQLKGIADPVPAWRVIAPNRVESRFEASHQSELTPLVGREHEIGLLLERWEQAKEGDGQVVLLCGEAGIGKSRITETLRERTSVDVPLILLYQCSPYHRNSALHPVIEQLERAAQFDDGDSPEEKRDKLESSLAQGRTDLETIVPLIAHLLSIPSAKSDVPTEPATERQKEQTLEALIMQLESLSLNQPTLLIFEDVHWADPTSLELLGLTIASAQRLSVLLVITFRPEFTPIWGEHTHVTGLTLNRFSRRLAVTLVDRVTGGKPLPEKLVQQIIEKTDGVPLFVEELTKTILESGVLSEETDRFTLTEPLSGLAIPATLQDSLMARLDRLVKGKPIAQTGAVIGREFSRKLLEAVSELQALDLDRALNELTDSGLVFRQGGKQESSFLFKHALVQEAAYESLLRSNRRSLHGRIAEAMLTQFSETSESKPELLAYHYTEADNKEAAIKYWLQAGRQAAQKSADEEAVGHLTAGLAVLKALPESTERNRRELEFHLALSSPFINTRGWGSVEAGASYARARELCELLGEIEQLLPILLGQWLTTIFDNILEAREIATELLHLSEQVDSVVGIMQSNRILGFTAFFHGDYTLMEPFIERSLSLYDPNKHQSLGLDWVYDPYVGGMVGRAICQLASGLFNQALKTGENFVAYARELDQLSTLVYALWNQCIFQVLARDVRAVEKLSNEALTIAEENGFLYYISECQMLNAWSAAKNGRREEGILLLSKELKSRCAAGKKFLLPFYFSLLAELHLDGSEAQEALHALSEAIFYVEQTEERMWEVEIYHLKGVAHIAQDPKDFVLAKKCLEKAIDIARNQGIRPLELRATVTLARFLKEKGESDAACSMLKPIYASFTEGFDAPDLIEARELLEQSN